MIPYISKEQIAPDLYSPRENHYGFKAPGLYLENGHGQSVQSLLKNDYQVFVSDYL